METTPRERPREAKAPLTIKVWQLSLLCLVALLALTHFVFGLGS